MTHSTTRDRQHLEQLWRRPPTPHRTERTAAPLLRWIALAGKSLISVLTDTRQMRIWTRDTRTGKLWYAYDPATEQTISHTSEEGLRTWLEQRHYQ
jgi:hypothetical protein